MRILITGGAGFVGSHLALSFRREKSDSAVVVLDNLKRRGSKLALRRLAAGGIEFRHARVRGHWADALMDLLRLTLDKGFISAC